MIERWNGVIWSYNVIGMPCWMKQKSHKNGTEMKQENDLQLTGRIKKRTFQSWSEPIEK